MSIVEIINHYQKSIDKSLNDEARLVHCIGKLYRLPISVQHLQETGIGRTVNGLRKYDGEVGVAAKALVTKWKTMVAAEESEDGGDQDESHEHGNADEDEDNYDESCLQVDEHHSDDHERHVDESDDQADQINGHEGNHHGARNVRADAELDSASNDHRTDRSRESSRNSKRANGEHSHRSSSSTKDGKSRDRNDKDRSDIREGKSHHNSSSHSSSSSRKSSNNGDKEKKDKHSSKNSSSSSSSSSSKKESSQSNNKKESSHSSSNEKSSSSGTHHSNSKVPNEGSNGIRQEGDIQKRRRSSEGEDDSQTKKVKNEKSSGKSRSSRTSKEKSSSSKASSSERSGKSSGSGSSKEKEKKSSDKKRESSSKKKHEESENSDEEVEGLDNSGGSSFADALSGIGMPSSSKKCKGGFEKIKKTFTSMPPPAAKVKSERSSYSSSKPSSKSKECYSPNSTASSSGYSSCSSTPSLLAQKVKLEPLPEAAEIVESLPLISPHYKPMPLNQTVMECVFQIQGKVHKRAMTEEEALGQSMQSKNLRTKVYSGVKNSKIGIPSLYDLCIRLLQENIDLIDYTGGIPFDLLKPVLERASPEQLFTLEDYNPYLMEDSDVLWEQHSKRMFRSQKRKEEYCESWREMYIRCSEERDAKLRSLTQNIKLSQVEKTAPLRKTQLAYIDSAVKPPRNVISKQVKYGTDRAPVVSPAARVASLKNASVNVTKAGDSRLKVAPGARDNAQVQVFHPVKPKKAPLMAKTMASIKGFKTGFRR